MRRKAGFSSSEHRRNEDIPKELKSTPSRKEISLV